MSSYLCTQPMNRNPAARCSDESKLFASTWTRRKKTKRTRRLVRFIITKDQSPKHSSAEVLLLFQAGHASTFGSKMNVPKLRTNDTMVIIWRLRLSSIVIHYNEF